MPVSTHVFTRSRYLPDRAGSHLSFSRRPQSPEKVSNVCRDTQPADDGAELRTQGRRHSARDLPSTSERLRSVVPAVAAAAAPAGNSQRSAFSPCSDSGVCRSLRTPALLQGTKVGDQRNHVIDLRRGRNNCGWGAGHQGRLPGGGEVWAGICGTNGTSLKGPPGTEVAYMGA